MPIFICTKYKTSSQNIYRKCAYDFSAGSIIVDYRVSWSDGDALNEDLLESLLKTYVKENHGYLYSYFVPVDSLTFSKQEDSCAMQVSEMK